MSDTACLTHTGRGDDNFRFLIEVDHFRLIARDRHAQSRKSDRVDALLYKRKCLLIKAVLHILIKNCGCLHGERAVHIHIEIFKFRQQVFRLDFSDKIQHLLRPAD